MTCDGYKMLRVYLQQTSEMRYGNVSRRTGLRPPLRFCGWAWSCTISVVEGSGVDSSELGVASCPASPLSLIALATSEAAICVVLWLLSPICRYPSGRAGDTPQIAQAGCGDSSAIGRKAGRRKKACQRLLIVGDKLARHVRKVSDNW